MSDKHIVILDLKTSNTKSVVNAVNFLGFDATVSFKKRDIKSSTHLIFPGVGSYASVSEHLIGSGMASVLIDLLLDNEKTYYLGICLGHQFLADRGHEFGVSEGLGIIHGEINRIDNRNCNQKLPHVGWSQVVHDSDSALFRGITQEEFFYFTHSYNFSINDMGAKMIAETEYCEKICAAVQKGRKFGVQFHPEKSQAAGLRLIKNYLDFQC